MKRKIAIALIGLLIPFIAFAETHDITTEKTIPANLRGGIQVDQQTINIALEIQKYGWEYIMPRPKSKKANWGNMDKRTTWWNGYWQNKKD